MGTLPKPPDKRKRRCLGCDKMFTTPDNAHRLCSDCKPTAEVCDRGIAKGDFGRVDR